MDDYSTVNPKFGTEADFKSLIDAAHAKGIKIYMDYVLNHSGANNAWFKSVKADPSGSEYKDYYVLSKSPDADVAAKAIDNYAGASSPGILLVTGISAIKDASISRLTGAKRLRQSL